MMLTPAAKHALDRIFLIATAIALIAVFVVSADVAGAEDAPHLMVRLILAGFVIARMVPWIRTKYRTWSAPRATTAPGDTTVRTTGLRRIDFYIGVAVVVVAVGLFAQSRRYTVTHYREGNTLIFQ